MAGSGRQFSFHGAFARKADAEKKERQIRAIIEALGKGGHVSIRRMKVRGQTRFLVTSRK